ncbi:Flp family type IVb pilin [Sphingomonas sp.]|jgi:pilus assembly protein Flp/PilA|uniref:Flp family type IVb pilin n=1 Tax=Sphingomonas sp. TaxID=28214 RepID=UPI002EDB0985
MRAAAQLLGKLIGDRKAATAVEYGLILALVVLAIITGVSALASTTSGMWNNVSNKVQSASNT